MVVGGGQLAKVFANFSHDDSVCIFASGVSNSACLLESEFEREKALLLENLHNSRNKKFVYFSSCALSPDDYMLNAYYEHKSKMELLIKENSDNYYIFRIPQLFGDLILHKTIVNFIYKAIVHNHKFNVYNGAFRYVIEIEDLKELVCKFIAISEPNIVIDFANPYRYSVLDLVRSFEKVLKTTASYNLVDKNDSYILNLSAMDEFVKDNSLDFSFGEDYFERKIEQKISGMV
ncbi:hypothetical protein LRP49_14970 [Enterovibrio sp. ZSDZ35]|uniref:NAD dependent epimerase/dehydratase family protein n=1 Tax=Enterovibrio qingdaonensis TaxID=2899818 RepID=A0ABT5QNA5_9GAMM|nr:hypothetical protein [Enterovibrio sp. ZSDZ35]MDD1782472.1 hypothetical protein [Enterovibrio sp. ZSDZ35]